MATYYDRLGDAFRLFEIDPPTSSAQLILLHLLHLHDAKGNCGSVRITDRDLAFRTRLNKTTITEAKRNLKNLGLIDFKTDKRTPSKMTTYYFTEISEEVVQSPPQVARQTVRQSGLVSYTHASARGAAEKESSPHPPFKEKDKTTTTTKGASARDGEDDGGEPLAGSLPLKSFEREMEEIIEEWSRSPCFAKLDYELIEELELLASEYGTKKIRETMKKAKRNTDSGGVSFAYFKAVVENQKKCEKKGSDEKNGNYEYARPAEEAEEIWSGAYEEWLRRRKEK